MITAKQTYTGESERDTYLSCIQVPKLGGTVKLKPQETTGNYVFSTTAAKVVFTPGFSALFHHEHNVIFHVIVKSLEMVRKTIRNPDYLQVLNYDRGDSSNPTSFWIKHDRSVITFLLPKEY